MFFLISQPLIYLLQVPFSQMGWNLFGYYRTWFIWTLLTFPMAYIGWYITKKNWLSLLILAPVLFSLTSDYIGSFQFTFKHFPYLLVTAVFCLFQVVIYLYTFTSDKIQKIIGFIVPLAIIVTLLFIRPQINVDGANFLPDNPVLTENAVVSVENTELANVSIESTGEDSMVRIQASKYGTTNFTITDGDKEYRYTLEIYEDDKGNSQIKIVPIA